MICVLLSTYNGEKYLEEQLESLVRQEGVELKILIRDDGSKDRTVDIIRKWQSGHQALIDFVQGENVGFAMSFTHLLQMAVERYADAEYYAFCDQDDVWLPEKLCKAVEKLQGESKDIPVAYCSNTRLVDANLRFLRMGWKKGEAQLTKERALIQSFATGCTMVFNRRAAEIYVSHLPEVIKVHDFLMYQLCMFLGKVVYDENSYILYRQHGSNQIGKPGFWNRCKKRLQGHYKEHVLELQNYRFLKAYKNLLSVDDIGLISQIAFYRRSVFSKLALLFSKKIKYTKLESNIFYMLKIVIGGGKTRIYFQSGNPVCFRCHPLVSEANKNRPMEVQVGVIIVLYRSDKPNYGNLIGQTGVNVILVDNTPERDLSLSEENVCYLPLKENRGIAAAQNVGIHEAVNSGCTHVVFFDQDSVIEIDYIKNIVAEYQRIESQIENLFLLGPTVFNGRTGEEYKSVVHKDRVMSIGFIPRREIISSGSCVSVSKIQRVGELSEQLFIDSVDFEYCWRANWKRLVSGITPNVKLQHFVGQKEFRILGQLVIISSPFRYFYQYRNYLWLVRKKYVPLQWKLVTGIKFALRIFYFPFKVENWFRIECNMWKGIWHGLFKYRRI